MSNPAILYNLMASSIYYKEFDMALKYAEELDEIIGYNYYTYYVQNELAKWEVKRNECLQQYNELVRVRKNDNENN